MKTKLIICGAYYYDKDANMVVKPLHTGFFSMVDCEMFWTKKEVVNNIGKQYYEDNKRDYVICNGVKYFYAGFAPCCVNENLELLSDLSGLRHIEEDFNF